MPHMPKGVEGLLDLRGSVLPVINMRTRMSLPPIETKAFENILLLDVDDHRTGILVDRVESVITVTQDQPRQLPAGRPGGWVQGFVILKDRVVVVLDTRLLTALGAARTHVSLTGKLDLAQKLDEDLKKLIELAPPGWLRTPANSSPRWRPPSPTPKPRWPRWWTASRSCSEARTRPSRVWRDSSRKSLGRLQGQEATVAEIERIGTEIQERIFGLLNQIQFQDIARQKLERILSHIRGLQLVVGQKFRDAGKA